MRRQQPRRRHAQAETASVDPIALGIAICLGVAVAIAGLAQLAQDVHAPTTKPSPALIDVN